VDALAAPVPLPSDDRSPLAKAYGWAARIMIVSLEMVLPGLAGYWLDQKLGTVVLFLLAGIAAGSACAMWQLMRMLAEDARAKANINRTHRTDQNSRE
jgi:Putative F0F1-ATPase subunit Ca2+/Mg2+ transporter